MAKIHVDRIARKLGIPADEMSGQNYQEVMIEVIDQNTRNIQRAVGRLTGENYQKQIDGLKKKGRLKEKAVLLPSMEEVLPKRSVAVTKAAESGRQVTQTLSDRMNKSLRDTLKKWQQEGKPLEIRSGRNAGKINPELIREFEGNIRWVFESYTRRDPSYGVPSNVRNIAVTEIRSNIDAVKDAYHLEMERKNADIIKMSKTWIHNSSLSKIPRPEHMALNGVTVPRDGRFKVALPSGGFTMMRYPHDPDAPLEAVIGCSCDCKYKAVLI